LHLAPKILGLEMSTIFRINS